MSAHHARLVEPLPRVVEPFDVLDLYADQEYRVVLEGASAPSRSSRYSFFCSEPFLVFRSKRARCAAGPPGALRELEGDPLRELDALLRAYRVAKTSWTPGLPPFLGGVVGYLGYEMLHLIEDVPDVGRDDGSLPDAHLIFCDAVIATDHVDQQSWVIATGFADSIVEATRLAQRRIEETFARLSPHLEGAARPGSRTTREEIRATGASRMARRPRLGLEDLVEAGIRPVMPKDAYCDVVRRAREHIFAGDVFEVCTSQRFDVEHTGSGCELYRALRAVNEAPFAAYLQFPETEILSSSPERFLRLDRDGRVEPRPMKGTRPRGTSAREDEVLINELETCEKDRAENLMIVDLARNDLGRVCEFGSIEVPDLLVVETYPFTHQLVSTVCGRLRSDVDVVDLLRAVFPAGSMTGAPKVEAMTVIDALEPVKRGVFSGSIGYVDFDGALDLSVVIRTLIKTESGATFHVGGAVVSDSVPEAEYQETLDKAHALLVAIELSRLERGA